MSDDKITKYPGRHIDVTWDSRLCIHMGECGHSEGELFVGGRDPWCQPELAADEYVRDVIKRCPSGALCYHDKASGDNEKPAETNTVQVVYNGPLFLRGDLDIENAADDMPGVRFRAALCRCGQSKKKPFCDNSHIHAGFEDFGAVGQTGELAHAQGGRLTVTFIKDGPIILSGNFAIVASNGRVAWRGRQTALCRCGHSRNKPFCDGSHKAAGFATD